MKCWILFLPLLLAPLVPMALRWQRGSSPVVRATGPMLRAPVIHPAPQTQTPLLPNVKPVAATLKPGSSDPGAAALGKGGIYPTLASETVSVPHDVDRDPHPPIRPVSFGPDGVLYQPADNKPR